MLPLLLQGEQLTGPALFVVLLSVAFLAFPCYYLARALQERGASNGSESSERRRADG